MALPETYLAALEQLALVFESYHRSTGGDAVLVGGAAVAIFTAGQFPSADFDVVASADTEFERAMTDHGFVREDRSGYLRIGFYHPDHPGYGFQQVSGALFDGRSERGRVVRVTVKAGEIALPSVEDLIADRLAQHAVASPTDHSRLRQARFLYQLTENLDLAYLRRRIVEENADLSLLEQVS
ncbi:MAG TPA: hypothetical protein DDZ81_23390 [Acetobacteraceae bacterium]|nr:hypothetical protein [Acetobacteraceae bacterium]